MPLPFPDLHAPGSGAARQAADAPRKLALNATVLVLSWLFLGQAQEAVLANLAIGVDTWNGSGLAFAAEAAGVDFLGVLEHAPEVLAKPVESHRLTFVDRPSFDPAPYLDAESRHIFTCPLSVARDLEEDEQVPRVAVRCSRCRSPSAFGAPGWLGSPCLCRLESG